MRSAAALLERARLVRTTENIQNYYHSHGYDQVKVEVQIAKRKGSDRQIESVLEIKIDEGKPTRISKVRFTTTEANSKSIEGTKNKSFRYSQNHSRNALTRKTSRENWWRKKSPIRIV